ncbi:MAG: gluconate 2-dehydrogenase subunit 3 family protein [Gemmatimonadaceae bacterium]
MSNRKRHPPAIDDANATPAESTSHQRVLSRRQAVGLLAALPLAGALDFSPPVLDRALRAAEHAHAAHESGAAPFTPKFFTPHEWRTVRVLVDDVIPRDATSGSATDAGVPEFMDFIMRDKPDNQIWMRGGLAWLDLECARRFGTRFAGSTPSQRAQMLDDIAYPAKAADAVRAGVAFFNRFRDLTSSGFWTTKMGIEDLHYMGNRVMPGWNGCPDAALAKLGVSYKDVY